MGFWLPVEQPWHRRRTIDVRFGIAMHAVEVAESRLCLIVCRTGSGSCWSLNTTSLIGILERRIVAWLVKLQTGTGSVKESMVQHRLRCIGMVSVVDVCKLRFNVLIGTSPDCVVILRILPDGSGTVR